jgi:hypothetical protein
MTRLKRFTSQITDKLVIFYVYLRLHTYTARFTDKFYKKKFRTKQGHGAAVGLGASCPVSFGEVRVVSPVADANAAALLVRATCANVQRLLVLCTLLKFGLHAS